MRTDGEAEAEAAALRAAEEVAEAAAAAAGRRRVLDDDEDAAAAALLTRLPLPSSLLSAALLQLAELQARTAGRFRDDAVNVKQQMRRLTCASDIALQAWLRRRAAVLARVVSLAPDADE